MANAVSLFVCLFFFSYAWASIDKVEMPIWNLIIWGAQWWLLLLIVLICASYKCFSTLCISFLQATLPEGHPGYLLCT